LIKGLNMKHKYTFTKHLGALAVAIAGGSSLGSFALPVAAQAVAPQSAVSPSGNGRFFVELKDATLEDAINMVLKAAGNPGNYTVDPQAHDVQIGSVTFANAAWDSIIRSLANQNGFTVRLVSDGSKIVEPRAPVFTEGFGGYAGSGGGYPGSGSSSSGGYPGGSYGGSSSGGYPGGGSSSGGYPGAGGGGRARRSSSAYPGTGAGLPSNPFNDPRSQAAQRTRRSAVIQQFADPQTAPSLGGGTAADEGKDYHLVPVRHVYVGGIAKLFSNAEVIGTEDFLIPDGAMEGGMGGMMGGGMGGMGGGMGGMGGGMGGMMGGMGGGMGGMMGGMGGMGGGFGGMGGGFGGMGGGMGGMGGGGYGGY
jgi:hypothetical protein